MKIDMNNAGRDRLISSLQSEVERLKKEKVESDFLIKSQEEIIRMYSDMEDSLKAEIERLKSSVSEKGKINASLNKLNQEFTDEIKALSAKIKIQDFWENEHDKLKKLVDTKASSTTGGELKSFSVSNEEGLNLPELEKRLDDALQKENKETINKFLKSLKDRKNAD